MSKKYWTIVFPGEHGQHVQETWSEDQILEYYWQYWYVRMVEKNQPAEELTSERCIQDWCIGHWAEETNEFGEKIDQRND
jgi:hypothetical protein